MPEAPGPNEVASEITPNNAASTKMYEQNESLVIPPSESSHQFYPSTTFPSHLSFIRAPQKQLTLFHHITTVVTIIFCLIAMAVGASVAQYEVCSTQKKMPAFTLAANPSQREPYVTYHN